LNTYHHHQQTNTQLFVGWMPFLSPNQQCRSTKGKAVLPAIMLKLLQQLLRSLCFQQIQFSLHREKMHYFYYRDKLRITVSKCEPVCGEVGNKVVCALIVGYPLTDYKIDH